MCFFPIHIHTYFRHQRHFQHPFVYSHHNLQQFFFDQIQFDF